MSKWLPVDSLGILSDVKAPTSSYMGRSTGYGSLSIWTHNLQDQEWFDTYKDPFSDYQGPAFRAHAGVTGHQLFVQADARGDHIVGGVCPTVGYVGGVRASVHLSPRAQCSDHLTVHSGRWS
jgi:hypothetical protein